MPRQAAALAGWEGPPATPRRSGVAALELLVEHAADRLWRRHACLPPHGQAMPTQGITAQVEHDHMQQRPTPMQSIRLRSGCAVAQPTSPCCWTHTRKAVLTG
jgi:hypothetical protein